MSRLHRCGRVVMVMVAIFGVGLAIYLSLKSSPRMTAVEWLPKWITRWADYHGQVRNFPAFALLSVPVLFIFQRQRQRAIVFGSLALLIVLLELLQIHLPQRSPDLRDMM